MSLLQTQFFGLTLLNILGFAGVIAIGLVVYLFTNSKKGMKLLRAAGIGREKPINEFKIKQRLEDTMEAKAKSEESDLDPEDAQIKAKQIFRDVEQLTQTSRGIGKEKEKMKGTDSEQLYNMVTITMLGNIALVILVVWKWFL